MAARSLSDSPRGAVTVATLGLDWAGARKLGLPITIHAGGKGRVALLEKEGMLGPDVQLINPTGFDEVRLRANCSIKSPRVLQSFC